MKQIGNQRGDIYINFKMEYWFRRKSAVETDRSANWVIFSRTISRVNIKKYAEIRRLDIEKMSGFAFDVHSVDTQFDYKLMGKMGGDIGAEFVEIESGSFDIDFDCVVASNYVISRYPSKCDFSRFHSLTICDGAALRVEPYGLCFESKSGHRKERRDWTMGFIRIQCTGNIVIENDCKVEANEMGYGGTEHHGPGREQSKNK